MTRTPGIIGQASYVPRLKLDLPGTFAPVRGEDPEKFSDGLGTLEASIPDLHDDPVSMASTAAFRVLENYGVEPSEIGYVGVGTESSFDNSKAMASYVIGNLEEIYGHRAFDHVRTSETKKACIGGTLEMDNAVNWVANERRSGEKNALVVASDVALYEVGDPGESTQGAYATAMLIGDVSEHEGLVEIGDVQGHCSRDINDFIKPELSKYPVVDGKGSIRAYCDAMASALKRYEEQKGESGRELMGSFDRIFFHVPFPAMAETAGAAGFWHGIRGTETASRLEDEIGEEAPKPERDDFDSHEEWREAYETWWAEEKYPHIRSLKRTDAFRDFYEEKIEPSLVNNRHLGNGYTASVHEARTGIFQDARRSDVDLADGNILCGSYGSGLQAKVHEERVHEDWKRPADKLNTRKQLADRKDLSHLDYLFAHNVRHMDEEVPSLTTPRNQFIWKREKGPMGERTYEVV